MSNVDTEAPEMLGNQCSRTADHHLGPQQLKAQDIGQRHTAVADVPEDAHLLSLERPQFLGQVKQSNSA